MGCRHSVLPGVDAGRAPGTSDLVIGLWEQCRQTPGEEAEVLSGAGRGGRAELANLGRGGSLQGGAWRGWGGAVNTLEKEPDLNWRGRGEGSGGADSGASLAGSGAGAEATLQHRGQQPGSAA